MFKTSQCMFFIRQYTVQYFFLLKGLPTDPFDAYPDFFRENRGLLRILAMNLDCSFTTRRPVITPFLVTP
jgi:hypothetical protein